VTFLKIQILTGAPGRRRGQPAGPDTIAEAAIAQLRFEAWQNAERIRCLGGQMMYLNQSVHTEFMKWRELIEGKGMKTQTEKADRHDVEGTPRTSRRTRSQIPWESSAQEDEEGEAVDQSSRSSFLSSASMNPRQ
jgi:hypothetical protein